jgi:hypothetical protein
MQAYGRNQTLFDPGGSKEEKSPPLMNEDYFSGTKAAC